MNNFFHYHDGALWVEQVPINRIAQATGTPCYVYSAGSLIEQWQALDNLLKDQSHLICFAVKANSNLAVLNTLAKLGSGFDIVSGGELSRVIAAGGDPKKVVFSGVGKTAEEIQQALQSGIFCFNVESEGELLLIQKIAQHENCQASISLRVNPDIDPQSHPYWSTGMKESKFGIEMSEALRLYQFAQAQSHLIIKGIACHIGSQILTLSPFVDSLQRINQLVEQLKAQQITLTHIDIGGGLGIRYQQETPPSAQDYISAIRAHWQHPECQMVLEPGRFIAASAGILITKVVNLKTAGQKNYCVVDAGMNDLMRPALYDSWHDILPVQQALTETSRVYDVVGPVCECGDFLGKQRSLTVQVDDVLAVFTAGAYGYVMSSNFNSRPRPPEVLVKGNEFRIVRKRENITELLAQESIW